MLKPKTILTGAGFIAAFSVVLWWGKTSNTIDFKADRRYHNALIRQQEQYAKFNQDILRTRYEVLISYDTLSQQIRTLKQLHEELKEIPEFFSPEGKQELQKLLEENQKLLQSREETIERFKAENAILKNSLRYLPTLAEEISRQIMKHSILSSSDRALLVSLDRLLQNLLIYNLTTDKSLEGEISQNLEELRQLGERTSDREYRELISLAIRHGEIILHCKPLLDSLVKDLLELPTDRFSETMEVVYNRHAKEAIQRANRYRLYAFAGLLGIFVWGAWLIIYRFQQAKQQTIDILESITDAFVAIDPQGKITYANPQAAFLLQQPLKILYQSNFLNIFPVPEILRCPLTRTMTGGTPGMQAIESYDANLQRWFEIRAYPQQEGFSIFLQDISDRKKTELELQELNRDLEKKVEERTAQLAESIDNAEKARRKAEEANRAKSIFLSNMSHELRTPLNAILGFTQVMERDRSLQGTLREHLGIISGSGEHLLELINDVLEMSKIEAGRTTLNLDSFDLYQLLESIFQLLHLQAEKKGLYFHVKRSPEVPQYVRGDRGKLRQVLINLLGNGIKFTQKGSVVLEVSRRDETKINQQLSIINDQLPIPNDSLSTHNKLLLITFEIRDTGAGIAMEDLETIFQPFVQTETGREQKQGTGLGLPISRQFVQLMGGELQIESQIGRGTCFYFTLPLPEATAAEMQPEISPKTPIALASGQPTYRFLIVDDKWENRLVLRQILQPLQVEIQEAEDGEAAIAAWENWQPDLIWMDMRMPKLDGYEATKIIRDREKSRNGNSKRVAIVAVTASAFESEQANVLAAGCDDFVRKPFRAKELFDRITKHLNAKFIYAEDNSLDLEEENGQKSPDSMTLTADTFSHLPLQWRQQFYEAASRADDEEMMALIQQIPSEYQDLISPLAELVESFQLDRLLEISAPPLTVK